MGDSSPANPTEMSDCKPSWPRFSLVISVFLWLLAWEVIVWFVPAQPRLAIRISCNDDSDLEISENLAGFSPDGKMVVTTLERITTLTGQIHLWDATTGGDLGIVGKEGTKLLPNVVYCPQRNLLTESGFSESFDPSIDRSRTYTLYDLTAGQERGPVQIGLGEGNHSCICISHDGRTLAYCTNIKEKGDLKLIDVATGQMRVHLDGGKYGDSAGVLFSQDGRILATTETKPNPDDNIPDDERLIVLDSRTREWRRIVLDYGEAPLHLVISPDGTKLAAECLLGTTKLGGSKNSEVRVWDLTNGKQFASFEAQGFPEFVEDGKGLALCHQEGVRFCDPTTGKEYAATKVSPNIYVGNIGFSVPIPRTHLLAVPTSHHSRPSLFSQWCSTYLGIKGLGEERYADELAFLDTRTGDKVAAIVRPRIADVQIFPDGKKLALMTFENNQSIIEIWDIPPRKPLRWILGLLAIPGVVTLFAIRRWRKASKRSSI